MWSSGEAAESERFLDFEFFVKTIINETNKVSSYLRVLDYLCHPFVDLGIYSNQKTFILFATFSFQFEHMHETNSISQYPALCKEYRISLPRLNGRTYTWINIKITTLKTYRKMHIVLAVKLSNLHYVL